MLTGSASPWSPRSAVSNSFDQPGGSRPGDAAESDVLGLAASSVGCLLLPPEAWSDAYANAPESSGDLQPFLREGESTGQFQEYSSRARAGFEILRRELLAFSPDAIVLVCCQRQGEVSVVTTTFKVVGGSSEPERQRADYRPRERDFVTFLLDCLVANDIDIAWDQGEATSMTESLDILREALLFDLDVPVIPLLINTTVPPLPSAERCWNLGLVLRKALSRRPERVAVVASGGLSYDPLGRWVDEPLDRWFLEALESEDSDGLKKLFKVETDALAGPTGEIRTWIVTAAACGGSATIVDYFPARQAKAGVGFALWKSAPSDSHKREVHGEVSRSI